MTAQVAGDTALADVVTRAQREQQLLELLRTEPTQVYAAYIAKFGIGTPDAPPLTPQAMVKQLLGCEFPNDSRA